MYDISKYDQLRHVNRSFDMDRPVDDQTYTQLVNYIDEFLLTAPYARKLVLTDKEYIETLFQTAFCVLSEKVPVKRVVPQMRAPLIISVYCTDRNDRNWIHIGRLYSKLALFAIEQGYHTGFNNCINYPMLRTLFDLGEFPFIPSHHTFLCIGNKLHTSLPHNWSFVTNSIMPSFKKSNTEFIKILN